MQNASPCSQGAIELRCPACREDVGVIGPTEQRHPWGTRGVMPFVPVRTGPIVLDRIHPTRGTVGLYSERNFLFLDQQRLYLISRCGVHSGGGACRSSPGDHERSPLSNQASLVRMIHYHTRADHLIADADGSQAPRDIKGKRIDSVGNKQWIRHFYLLRTFVLRT